MNYASDPHEDQIRLGGSEVMSCSGRHVNGIRGSVADIQSETPKIVSCPPVRVCLCEYVCVFLNSDQYMD